MNAPRLSLLMAAAAACGSGPRTPTVTSAWQMVGSTVSVAAWANDTVALRAAVARLRASTSSIDSSTMREALGRAWAAERGDLRLRPEWGDVRDSYVLDLAMPALAGVADSALVDLGGLFLWVGPATKRLVGIADPDNSLDALAHVELTTGALSTVRGEHRSITVLARNAFTASAWASALFSLGCDRALALAPQLERRGVSVVCADSAGVRWSPDVQSRVFPVTARAP